ncbi:DHH family protein [Streptococcus pneumoniae]|nr:DHH family protein [Streptococcus pneumoniae]
MPVGVMKLNLSSGEVEWFNPYAELILTKEDGDFDLEAVLHHSLYNALSVS